MKSSTGISLIKLTDEEFHYLVQYLKERYGIDLARKRVLLEGRLSNYLNASGYANYTEYIRALKADSTGRELANLIDRVTTNHTFFMREPDHFQFFRQHLLPYLEQTVTDRDLRIWSAATSSGEEAYTLAMILHDYFGARLPAWDKRILATDISTKVLEQAASGIYPLESVANLPAGWRGRYFERYDDSQVQVKPLIRKEIEFRAANLMEPLVAKKPYHVIFCRNVMIYFDAATKASLTERLYQVLCPGGYLFIGHTEAIAKPTRFEYVMPAIYRKGGSQ